MKIEVSGKDDYVIFLNRSYLRNVNFSEKDDVIIFIKDFLLKLKSYLCLRGFYKVKVFPQDKIGMFLELLKLDDMDLSNNLDLRIIVMQEEKFFFETDDYDLIKNCNNKRYYEGHFYCVVDDYFDELLEKVEFGRFIYGKEVINLLNKGIVL